MNSKYLMPFKDPKKRRLWERNYQKRWLRTPSGRESRRRAWKKYLSTPKGKATVRRRDAKRTLNNRVLLARIKSKPCHDCARFFPTCCMDFHHVYGRKLFRVGQGVNRSTKTLLKEIRKCILVCANCHRIRHMRSAYKKENGNG